MSQFWILPNFLCQLRCWWIFLLISTDMLNILFAFQMFKSSIFWITIWTWCIVFHTFLDFCLCIYEEYWSVVHPSPLMPILSFSGFDVRVFLSSKMTLQLFVLSTLEEIVKFYYFFLKCLRICPCNSLGLESSFVEHLN